MYLVVVVAKLTLDPTKILFAALLTASAWLDDTWDNVEIAGTSDFSGFGVVWLL